MKRGFTLIELLAVIVILAIIAVIATPIVLNIIKDAKKSSNIRSAENYISAVENAIANKNLNGEFNPSSCSISKENNKSIIICDGEELEVETSGLIPSSGYIILKNGKVEKYDAMMDNQVVGTIAAYDVWDGSEADIVKSSDGYYHITKASEFAKLASLVNSGTTFEGETIVLDTNLDLNGSKYEWIPIGTYTSHFSGSFKGNNHSIRNIYVKKEGITDNDKGVGLFGYIEPLASSNVIISDITILDSNITGYSAVGSFSGYIRGEGTIDINNIVSYNNKLFSNNKSIGGVIGILHVSGSVNNLNTYSNTITGVKNKGGIVGYSTTDTGILTINNSFVDNKTIINTSDQVTGGISGYTTNQVTISNCIVYIIINSTSDCCGGITGTLENSSKVINSKSYADVSGITHVSGLVGYGTMSGIEDCEDYSNIKGTSKTGSIFGEFYNSYGSVKNTFSSGTVNGVKTTSSTLFGVTPDSSYIAIENVNAK